MPIKSKPNRSPSHVDIEANVLAYIDKGGGVAASKDAPQTQAQKQMQHPLKFLNRDLFDRLEVARKAGDVKISRNTWILQAISEKLSR